MKCQSGSHAPRLLYLGFAFPPGVQALYPGSNPAGHALETRMVAQLRQHFEIRSAGILPLAPPRVEWADPESGIEHDLILTEKPPELLHRARSLWRLKARYRCWQAEGWEPDLVLVYNLSPIYNQFLLWLQRQRPCPKLVLLLLDSTTLGQSIPRFTALRRRFKPMHIPDAAMLGVFDACIGLSHSVGKYFRSGQVPFLWMPGGCTPTRALPMLGDDGDSKDPIRFGYFGALGPHSGVEPLAEAVVASQVPASLEICGYGKMDEHLRSIASRHPRLRYHGLISPAECLRFGRSCDVLVNPRPASHGNENNFASKLFEYALTGRAILTSNLSGVEAVLGPEAYYFDPRHFAFSLSARLATLAATPRAELNRRGAAIQRRILTEFSWERQGVRIAQFLHRICADGQTEMGRVPAPASELAPMPAAATCRAKVTAWDSEPPCAVPARTAIRNGGCTASASENAEKNPLSVEAG